MKRPLPLFSAAVFVLLAIPAFAAPPLLSINNRYGHENYPFMHVAQVDTMSLVVTATDADLTIPNLFAANLPAGASFVDSGNGVGVMFWSPNGNQYGFYYPRFTASDGLSQDTDTATILVNAYPLSHGIYRLGYMTGTNVRCSQDYLSHNPILKYDVIGSPQFQFPDSIPIEYQLAAAADGLVEEIIDTNCACCSGCSACNNHIRIRHSNGEWTKYSHPEQGSVVVDTTGPNACVNRGEYLGEEGDVGATTGGSSSFNRNQKTCGQLNDCAANNFNPNAKCAVHLHFEVRMSDAESGLRIPLFCEIPGYVLRQGDSASAGSCAVGVCPTDVSLPTVALAGNLIQVVQAADQITNPNTPYEVGGTASVYFQSANRITLKPGFHAKRYSYFHARIAPCNSSSSGCPPN